jgi:hypothetical protein
MKRSKQGTASVIIDSPDDANLFTRSSRVSTWGLAAGLCLLHSARGRAEDQADYRFENYQEDGGRIHVQTHSLLLEKAITSWLSLKGDMVYDAISGATPTGGPAPSQVANLLPPQTEPFSSQVPTQHMEDERWAGSAEATLNFGRHHITPGYAYSTEHDYLSHGISLNYAIDLNQKNTTLNAGWSHNFDQVLPNSGTYISKPQNKDTDEFLIGVNQLLGPKTVLTANFTYRNSHGYMDDPYRGVFFDNYPQFDPNSLSLFPEHRPGRRESYIGYLSLSHFVTKLDGSVEGSYRIYDDSFGILAHTVGLAWHQKIGSRVILSPVFRYYRQTAADFYGVHFAGDPSNPFDTTPVPAYYSADYRLSELETFTGGLELNAKITERFSLDLSYKRYEMHGLDRATSPSAYPSAHIVTAGLRVWF